MSETKELIGFVQYLIHRETKADEHRCRKDVRLKYLEEIKSILEQQYQHEQNILNYGTDEPEEQQAQASEPDEELVEYFDGIYLFLANHGFTEVDQRAVAIRKLLKGEKYGT